MQNFVDGQIEQALTGEESSKLKQAVEFFEDQNAPKIFSPSERDNVIVKSELQFEAMTAAIEEAGGDARRMTAFQFYSRLKYMEDKAKKIKELHKK